MEAEWRVAGGTARPSVVTSPVLGGERETPPALQPAHDDLKKMLVEVGKFQNYITAVEYHLDLRDQHMRLDVVWKRELEGVPTFAFEVELSGNVERAGVRLKHAFERWNSRPYLIVPIGQETRARNSIVPSNDAFGQSLRLATPEKVRELHEVKTRLRKLERDIGLIA